MWVNEWLDGTTRFEMTDVQRAFWTDLLAMAGRSRYPGRICAGQTADGSFVGYPLNKFQGLMSEPLDVEQTFVLFVRTGKVKATVTSEEPKLVMLELLNWDKYQSEYQRQKPYRRAKLQKGDSESYNQSNNTEVEGDVDVEEREEKKRIKYLVPAAQKRDSRLDDAFEKLWETYPRKRGKEAARTHFRAQVKTPLAVDALQSAIANYAEEIRILGKSDEFIMHGSRFFNKVWRDFVSGTWTPPLAAKLTPKAVAVPTANQITGFVNVASTWPKNINCGCSHAKDSHARFTGPCDLGCGCQKFTGAS